MEPTATRPHMPGYGVLPPSEGIGLLPWSWAEARLASSHDYWVATAGRDGQPNVMPVWGLWREDRLWFSSSPGSRRARNLARDSRCTATTDNPREPVVVEGVAQRIADDAAVAAFAEAVNVKYESDYPVEFFADNALFAVRPVVVFGLTQGDFTGSPTRWAFPGG